MYKCIVQMLRAYRLEESVREDLDFLKSHPLVRQEIKNNAKGYIYDIKTGRLNPVVLPSVNSGT